MTMLASVARQRSTPRAVGIGLYVFTFAAVGTFAPYIQVFFEELGLPLDAIGLIVSLSALAALIAAPTWGVLADQALGVRGALFAAAVAAALCALGMALATAAVVAALIWILYWLASSGLAPVLDAYALDQVGSDRNRYARFRMWGSASFMVAAVLVGLLIEQTSTRALFVVLVGCLLAAAALAALVPARTRTRVSTRARGRSGLRTVLRTPALMGFIAAAMLVFIASTMVNTFYSIYLVALDAPTALVGSAWALGAIVEVPLMLAFPALATRFGVGRLLVVSALCFLLRAVVVFVASDPLVVVAAMGLHGVAFALMVVGGVTYVASLAPAGHAATAQGVFSGVIFGLAQAIGPAVAGVIAGATSINTMFGIAAVVSGFAVAAVALAVGWYAPRVTRAV